MCRFWKQVMACAVLVAAVGLWCSSPAVAKGPGGGGGGGGPVLVDLHPANATYSDAWSISDGGQIVGESDGQAGIWDGNAGAPTFTALAGGSATALGQNEAGEIVGYSVYDGRAVLLGKRKR